MGLNFCSLSSGSSGNCYYLGNEKAGILVDAGIPTGNIRKFLKDIGVSIQSIRGVLITHNHSDHIKGLALLARKNYLPVFTTAKIWKSILARKINVSGVKVNLIELQQKFQLSEFEIEAFPVSHDAPETVGFHIRSHDYKTTIVTDLGHICQTASSYIKEANMLVIESNYDEQMLVEGAYPPFLKARIRSDKGHLGNHQTAAFLADNMGVSLERICLAHLSNKNNTPELALKALQQTFEEKGISTNGQLQISILNRTRPSGVISLF